MKIFRKLALGASVCVALSAAAVPALRQTYTVVQPDGSTVTLTGAGNEFNKYFLTSDNKVVLNHDGGYYFATVAEDGTLCASTLKATDPANRTAADNALLSTLSTAEINNAMTLRADKSRLAGARTSRSAVKALAESTDFPQKGVGLNPDKNFPSTGSPKAAIIIVEYKDVKFNLSDPKGYFTSMLSEQGFSQYGGTGSVYDWFVDASKGEFTPEFVLLGPVTLSQNRKYYGANSGYYGDDVRPEQMVVEACQQLDATVDWSEFDNDGDGVVDNIYVFYAGVGEASAQDVTEAVWPHQWSLDDAGVSLTLDGVKINSYGCSNEWFGNRPDGIGTFVHEFSHVLGLPDLYHTTTTAYYTPCEWSVLDYGPYNNDGCTPPTYSVYERNALGWGDITLLSATPSSYELENLMESNKGFIIPTSSNNEFFCLENRQQVGWDTYLPGHGMLIWHIDYQASRWTANTVNNVSTHQYVDIEEANNNPAGDNATALSNWAFPGTSGQYTSFTDDTTPNMRTWAGTKLGMPITNIAETNGIITFDLCGGKAPIDAPVAYVPEESAMSGSHFTARWDAVDGAADYLLSVYSLGELVEDSDKCTFGSSSTATLSNGWTSSTTGTYTTSGNYGESSPSLKFSKAGDWLMTPAYDDAYITSISFWAKGQSQKTNTVEIYAVDGDDTTLLGSINSWSTTNTDNDHTFNVPNTTTKQIKLMYLKESSGNLAIDDVVVNYYSDGAQLLDNYNAISTGLTTSYVVDQLPEGKLKFRYTVQAVNSEGKKSADSNAVDVTLPTASISEINADLDATAPVEYFDLQGRRVNAPSSGIYIRRQGSTVEKVVL